MDTLVVEKAVILNLEVPFTKEELKHNFRELCFKYHPDLGGSAEKFKEIKDAYDLLLPFCVTSCDKEVVLNTTVEGSLIFDLGKGLGGLVNSDDCPNCKGKGWYKAFHRDFSHEEICYACNGTGGHGSIFSFLEGRGRWQPCSICMGLGIIHRRSVPKEVLHTCLNCKGTGQIRILNPVLWKGRTTANFKNEDKRPKKSYCTCGALLVGSHCWRCKK